MGINWVERARELSRWVENLVDGHSSTMNAGPVVEKFGPRDGRSLCKYRGDLNSVDEAVEAARHAFEDGRWSDVPMQRRKDVLQKLAELIDEHREEFAVRECLDVGKPISEAFNFDVPTSSAQIRFCAEAIDKVQGKLYAVNRSNLSYELRRPIGVVGGIIGWNFPLLLAAQKIGPALVTGNCLVLKPSELTSFSAWRLAALALEAGVPEGVFNVIHGGPDIGHALARHPSVDLLTFTGSSRTGKRLLMASGESNMKRVILECGGKAPNIVFDDCPNLEAVADGVVARAFWNQGEVCSASSRLLVQEGIKQELLGMIIRKTDAIRPGDPLDQNTTFGALVSEQHKQKVLGYIERGIQEGAKVIHQSNFSAPYEDGYYVSPTIFADVCAHHRIAQEEIFGPVLSVLSFRDDAEALAIANGTAYGLTAIVWTRDLGRAHRMAYGIRAGMTIVNATAHPSVDTAVGLIPVGGLKESGIGTEGGLIGLTEYMSTTAVQVFV